MGKLKKEQATNVVSTPAPSKSLGFSSREGLAWVLVCFLSIYTISRPNGIGEKIIRLPVDCPVCPAVSKQGSCSAAKDSEDEVVEAPIAFQDQKYNYTGPDTDSRCVLQVISLQAIMREDHESP